MKNIKTIAVVTVLGLAICGFAIAQTHHVKARGPAHHFKDAASAVEHLTEMFPKFAQFDTNKDGQFDATEKESLGEAIAEGKLQLPAQMPPDVAKETPAAMQDLIAEDYVKFA